MGTLSGPRAIKPNYMPKKYAIAILPISGFLVSVAALASISEDTLRWKGGTFEQNGSLDS